MLSIVRIHELIADIRYRDWTFHVVAQGDSVLLQMRFLARDESAAGVPARHEHSFLQFARMWRLSRHMTETEIVQTALLAVLTAEEHEARESFRFRGRAIFGPHHTLDALIASYDAAQPDARPHKDSSP